MKLTLVTPTKKIVEDQPVKTVVVPACKGEMEILDNHADLITLLNVGALSFKTDSGEESSVAISWGYCQVFDDNILVLAETAELGEEIDESRAKTAREEALKQMSKVSFEDFEKYRRKFQRAETRIKVSKQNH